MNQKMTISALMSAFALFSSCAPAYAQTETNESALNEGSSEDSGQDLGFDVDEFYEETLGQFAQMKQNYSDLADNYGNVEGANAEAVYMDYLEALNQANVDSGYDKKLEMIRNTDLSISDPQISAAYNRAKAQVKNALNADGLDITGKTTSSDLDANEQNRKMYEAMASQSESVKMYQTIVQDYKNKGSNITSYTGKDLKTEIRDGNPLTASSQAKGSFLSTATIYQKISSGKSIETLSEQYGTDNADEFVKESEKKITAYKAWLTEDGEPLTTKQQKEYDQALQAIEQMKTSLDMNDQGDTAVQMSRIKNYLERHKIQLNNAENSDE
ncbi:hypothetical protein [Ileibacterium valens]|uniref:hypothetical protein n=1 Tax=Ileibacterium valens TaxID=1862668 RepID=UPI0025712CD8|nr:hypothetical protein [Ileibacterium valens]